jgi:hypothetical protein
VDPAAHALAVGINNKRGSNSEEVSIDMALVKYETYTGIWGLKIVLAVCGAISLVYLTLSSIPTTDTFRSQYVVFDISHGVGSQIAWLVNVLLFFGGSYGLHRKAPIVWKLGPWIFSLIFFDWVVESLVAVHGLPKAWIASFGIAIAGFAGIAFWFLWWRRQKGYFIPKQ